MSTQGRAATFTNCSSKISPCYLAEEISLELTLFDESWVANKPKINTGSAAAASSYASLNRDLALVPEATGSSLRIHDSMERGKRPETENTGAAFSNSTNRSCGLADEISLELTLFDESWVAKKPKIKRGAAASSSASPSRDRAVLPEATGSSLSFHDSMERGKRNAGAAFPNSTKRWGGLTDEVSLQLALFDKCWVAKKPRITMGTAASSSAYVNRELISNDVISEETDRIISRILNLKHKLAGSQTQLDRKEDPWKIKRKITISDIVVSSRLVVPRSLIENYVLPLLQTDLINEIQKEDGARVEVLDQDTRSLNSLVFKKWPTGDYVFMGAWNTQFIRRRKLREGDEIGFYWDPDKSRFNFAVLKWASISQSQTNRQQSAADRLKSLRLRMLQFMH